MTSDYGRLDHRSKYSHLLPDFHWMKIFFGSFDVGHGNVICFVLLMDGVYVLPFDPGLALTHGRLPDVTQSSVEMCL